MINKISFSFFLFSTFLGLICVSAFSCKDRVNGNQPVEETKSGHKSVIIKKPGASSNDTLVIHGDAAVFYSPDSVQANKIRLVNEPAVYATITHDCYYQMQNAHQVLKKYWPKVKIIDNAEARYLLFQIVGKRPVCIDLNSKNDICGLFLFDGHQDPVLVDMPNIDTALGFYFTK